ncbi:ADP-ribosyltransferase domain-containing protein [Nocardioides sp. S-58]|uniref:NAD(+)--protein-arginine ADP-ribosyltransferase n=1 Tax=Nocardioides renjunii TaxID=3095075 RepID=A0ABU5K889_9ACTN|nr:ADP-ribosyltransferase domain-containing protein [Nocardioides sp. S-58]MDZ5661058.1 ADP-ribosyltransferase domain-containing protein [Nocardioides sp. S-58]
MPDFEVEGNPGNIRSRAVTMEQKGQLFYDTGDALAKIDVSGWTGRAADEFREAHDLEPERWFKSGNGFKKAAAGLTTYAGVLEDVQRRAAEAKAEYERGQRESESARTQYDSYMGRMRTYWSSGGTDQAEPFVDWGDPIQQDALRALQAARADLDNAAAVCAGEVRAGCADAPEEPNWLESGLKFVGGILEGAGEAVWDLLTMVPFSPVNMVIDAYKLATGDLTPEELMTKYELSAENAWTMAQGIYTGLTTDPVGFGKELGKSLLDWDTWADDPARAIGHLVPDAVAAVATAGTGALATRGAKGGMDLLDGLSDLSRLDELADLNKLDNLDDLGGLNRLDDLGGLHRYDDVPAAPQGVGRTLGDSELDPWLDEVSRAHPELDREGVRGIWDYTTNDGYDTMNNAMRQIGPNEAHVQARIDATNRGLDQLPDYEGTTYRGTNLPDDVVERINNGGNLSDGAFTSSSTNPNVAEGFLNPSKDNPTRITIEGHSGSNVGPFSAAQKEAEILFRGGTEFEVLSNTVGPDGVRQLVVREIP